LRDCFACAAYILIIMALPKPHYSLLALTGLIFLFASATRTPLAGVVIRRLTPTHMLVSKVNDNFVSAGQAVLFGIAIFSSFKNVLSSLKICGTFAFFHCKQKSLSVRKFLKLLKPFSPTQLSIARAPRTARATGPKPVIGGVERHLLVWP
jgi:hypothetical protein